MINRSGTITVGGTRQPLAAARSNRKYLFVQNPSTATESLYVDINANAAVGTAIELLPGASLELTYPVVPVSRVDVLAATTGHAFVAKEF